MSALLVSKSSIISTSTSITSTARIRVTKVLARYQVSVRDGKKSNSIDRSRGDYPARAVAPPPQPLELPGEPGVGRFERADRLSAGHVGHGIEHPHDHRREHRERPPQREIGIEPPELGGLLPVLVDLVVGDHEDDRDEHAQRRR